MLYGWILELSTITWGCRKINISNFNPQCGQWILWNLFVLPSHYQLGRPGTAFHSTSARSPRFPAWCLSGRCCDCGNCAHSCLKNKMGERRLSFRLLKQNVTQFILAVRQLLCSLCIPPCISHLPALILLSLNCEKKVCECEMATAWLTCNSNMTICFPFIYHIHNFLRACDKPLCAALSERNRHVQTFICALGENKGKFIYTYWHASTNLLSANECFYMHVHFAHIPAQ